MLPFGGLASCSLGKFQSSCHSNPSVTATMSSRVLAKHYNHIHRHNPSVSLSCVYGRVKGTSSDRLFHGLGSDAFRSNKNDFSSRVPIHDSIRRLPRVNRFRVGRRIFENFVGLFTDPEHTIGHWKSKGSWQHRR